MSHKKRKPFGSRFPILDYAEPLPQSWEHEQDGLLFTTKPVGGEFGWKPGTVSVFKVMSPRNGEAKHRLVAKFAIVNSSQRGKSWVCFARIEEEKFEKVKEVLEGYTSS